MVKTTGIILIMWKVVWDKYFFLVGVLVLSLLGAWLFRANFYFSQSYDILALKHVDDIVFHIYLLHLREAFLAGRWVEFFGSAFFAYGNIYWLTILAIVSPFAAWGPEWMPIVVAREVSLVAAVLCFVAFYRIARERGYSRGLSMCGLLLLASCGEILFVSTCFHNHTPIAALVLWSIYFLVLPPTKTRRRIASLLFGMVLGLKLSALFALPIFLLFYNRQVELKKKKIFTVSFFKSNASVLIIISVTALLFYSPTVLLLPFGNKTFITDSLDPLYNVLFVFPHQLEPQTESFLLSFTRNFFDLYYHWTISALGLFFIVVLIFQKRKKSLDAIVMPMASLMSVVIILVLAKINMREPDYLRYYILPFSLIFSFVFLEFAAHYKKPWLLGLVVGANLWLNYDIYKFNLLTHKINFNSPQRQAQFQKQEALKTVVQINKDDLIYLDMRIAFPLGALAHYKNVKYIYNSSFTPKTDADLYIFSKQLEKIPDEIRLAQAPYQKLYEDEDMEIVRQPRKP